MLITKHELNTKLLELLPDPSGKKEIINMMQNLKSLQSFNTELWMETIVGATHNTAVTEK